MGEANANANGLLSTALSLCRLDLCLKGELSENKNPIAYLQPLKSSERLQHNGHSGLIAQTGTITCTCEKDMNKGIGDAGSTADLRILWSAIVCLGLGLL